jgi:hypothetical protein
LVVLLQAVVALAPLGCSYMDEQLPRPGECPAMNVVEIRPGPGEVGVPVEVAPTATFSDFPDPDTVNVSTMSLYTAVFRHTGRYHVDLLDRRASFRPSGPLQRGLGYTTILRAGIRSLRGCELPLAPGPNGTLVAEHYYRFQTIEPGDTPSWPRPVTSPPPSLSEVLELFGRGCAGGTCHVATGAGANEPGDDGASCLARPAGGLSLCGRDARASLVDVPSLQVTRLQRVVPHDASRSYLLRKLLGAPPLAGHILPSDWPIGHAELRTLSLWIDAGAGAE